MATEVQVAVIGAIGLVIVALIERVRRQNHREHGQTGQRIDGIHYQLGKIDATLEAVHDKIDNHLHDHRSNTK